MCVRQQPIRGQNENPVMLPYWPYLGHFSTYLHGWCSFRKLLNQAFHYVPIICINVWQRPKIEGGISVKFFSGTPCMLMAMLKLGTCHMNLKPVGVYKCLVSYSIYICCKYKNNLKPVTYSTYYRFQFTRLIRLHSLFLFVLFFDKYLQYQQKNKFQNAHYNRHIQVTSEYHF